MSKAKRKIFYLSDSTGITTQTLGHSLLSMFEHIEFDIINIPYVDDKQKAEMAVAQINQAYTQDNQLPIIFATLVKTEIREIIKNSRGVFLDFLQTFLNPLEQALGVKASVNIGRSHGLLAAADSQNYFDRIEAVNFALAHDDGLRPSNYHEADIILVGVSRCGKTPTSLYLALQFGVLTANYPMTDDDLSNLQLPKVLKSHKQKCFGLSINANRLQAIRSERRPNSQYASLETCRLEINEVEALFRRENIPFINTTSYSIEEISTRIRAVTEVSQRTY